MRNIFFRTIVISFFILSLFAYPNDKVNIKSKSFFFKKKPNIIGLLDLVKTIYPHSQSDENFLIVPSKNNLLSIIFKKSDIFKKSFVFIEQTNILSHEVIYSWFGNSNQASELYPSIIKNINAEKFSSIPTGGTEAIGVTIGKNSGEEVFWKMVLQMKLKENGFRVINNQLQSFLFKIQKNYFINIKKTMTLVTRYVIDLTIKEGILEIDIYDSFEGKSIVVKKFSSALKSKGEIFKFVLSSLTKLDVNLVSETAEEKC